MENVHEYFFELRVLVAAIDDECEVEDIDAEQSDLAQVLLTRNQQPAVPDSGKSGLAGNDGLV